MSKFEKRLILFAIGFVVIYLGAAVVTLQHRFGQSEAPPLRYESEVPTRAEGRLGMAELLLPMLVLLTLAVTYAVVKKKRAAQMAQLDESEDEMLDTGRAVSSPSSATVFPAEDEKSDRSNAWSH
jgi:hypothetical protein